MGRSNVIRHFHKALIAELSGYEHTTEFYYKIRGLNQTSFVSCITDIISQKFRQDGQLIVMEEEKIPS